jgi:hypothetical protein
VHNEVFTFTSYAGDAARRIGRKQPERYAPFVLNFVEMII